MMEQKVEFKSLDLFFGQFISRLAGNLSPEIRLAAELVSMATRAGHGCLDLREWAGQDFVCSDGVTISLPPLEKWREAVAFSAVVGGGADSTPLVLENERLYLRRYWEYEEEIVSFLLSRGQREIVERDLIAQSESIKRLFPERGERFRWHRLAALASLLESFVVITGGPGTGKTTTIARIMALLIECSGDRGLRIALSAPTGKAVMRMQESISGTLRHLDCSQQILEKIPVQATTLHRLLGSRKDSPYFKHNAEHKLPYDLVVVDEASMIDLPLMAKLFRALPLDCKLIILGDRDQLSSVEPGAVLGDICARSMLSSFSGSFISEARSLARVDDLVESGKSHGHLADSLVELHAGFRFGENSGVGKISRAVNNGDSEEMLRIANSKDYPDVIWRELSSSHQIEQMLREIVEKTWWFSAENSTPEMILSSMGQFQILCALRNGPYGVVDLNRVVQRIISKQRFSSSSPDEMIYYAGLPLIITKNDYQLGLFNGDTGVVARDSGSGENLRAFFPAAGGGTRSFCLANLPPHERCYAVTVHKSQGSEFGRVILILPDKKYPVLTRELIYTAVSRARSKIEIWGKEEVLKTALDSVISRRGGLKEKLWGRSS